MTSVIVILLLTPKIASKVIIHGGGMTGEGTNPANILFSDFWPSEL
jgi:hypothetical protein